MTEPGDDVPEERLPWRDRVLLPWALGVTAALLLVAALLSWTPASIWVCLWILVAAALTSLGAGVLYKLLRYLGH